MTYYYSLFGLMLNLVVWSGLILFLRQRALIFINKAKEEKNIISYKIITGCLIAFATVNILLSYIKVGKGFDKYRNYWHFDIDKEAEKWGLDCDLSILGS